MENKMNVKKLMVSFAILVSVLFLAVSVSAQTADNVVVEVNGIEASENPAIVVGETIFVRVEFEALESASEVTVKAEIDGNRERVEVETNLFDIEEGQKYSKTLALKVPFDLRNDLSGNVDLNVKISGTDLITYQLRVQRESFNVDILSVEVPSTAEAGNSIPVDVVLKNRGYNDLDDLFVTVRISALNIERTAFFGDLISLECNFDAENEDNWGIDVDRKCIERKTDTSAGRISLNLPFDVEPGVYALEVKVESEDISESETLQIVVENPFSEGNFIISGNQVLIVNPTNKLVVYNLVPKSVKGTSISLSESLVAVPAGSSRTVTMDFDSDSGEETFFVDVFSSDGTFVETLEFEEVSERKDTASPIVILTIILAIIFVVLLVVLIVLIGKKPKTEEFGESYY
ncbi:MAG: hypothetical protein WDZ62_02400 [Candidatus Pacearchaeota archaeon]